MQRWAIAFVWCAMDHVREDCDLEPHLQVRSRLTTTCHHSDAQLNTTLQCSHQACIRHSTTEAVLPMESTSTGSASTTELCLTNHQSRTVKCPGGDGWWGEVALQQTHLMRSDTADAREHRTSCSSAYLPSPLHRIALGWTLLDARLTVTPVAQRALHPEEKEALLASGHRPNFILRIMTELVWQANLQEGQCMRLDETLSFFEEQIGTCERWRGVPMHHLSRSWQHSHHCSMHSLHPIAVPLGACRAVVSVASWQSDDAQGCWTMLILCMHLKRPLPVCRLLKTPIPLSYTR